MNLRENQHRKPVRPLFRVLAGILLIAFVASVVVYCTQLFRGELTLSFENVFFLPGLVWLIPLMYVAAVHGTLEQDKKP